MFSVIEYKKLMAYIILFHTAMAANTADNTRHEVFDIAKRGSGENLIKSLRDVDPNVANEHGSTPLILYLFRHKVSEAILEQLLEAGADLNKATKWGTTPLHVAALKGHHEIIDWLLKNGANPFSRTTDGGNRTPLDEAIHSGHTRSVARLVFGYTPEEVEETFSAFFNSGRGRYLAKHQTICSAFMRLVVVLLKKNYEKENVFKIANLRLPTADKFKRILEDINGGKDKEAIMASICV